MENQCITFVCSRPTFCSRTYIASPSVTIYSPNFPAPYLNGERCSYTVRFTRDDICHFRLNFVSFGVEPSVGCNKGPGTYDVRPISCVLDPPPIVQTTLCFSFSWRRHM